MILVVGATGLVGHEVCLKLKSRGKQVRGLVRTSSDPAKVKALSDAGVELCYGDLKNPETLTVACQNVDAVVSTATSTVSRSTGDSIESVDGTGQLNLVKAAKDANIDRFVFVSFDKAEGISFPLADAKAAVEKAIAGMDHTILLASWFMEVWLSPAFGFDYVHGSARIFGPGTNPITWVSSKDVAEMCVLALENRQASRATLHFGGPQPLSPFDVVRCFEKLSGREFRVEHVPLEPMQEQFLTATDPMQRTFAALSLGYAAGDSIDMSGMQRDYGIQLTSVETYARRVLGA